MARDLLVVGVPAGQQADRVGFGSAGLRGEDGDTDLLTPESTSYPESSIEDYAERTKQTVETWNGMNGRQGGDPAKPAAALISLANSEGPPVRWVAGADAGAGVQQKAQDLQAQVDAHRVLSSSPSHDDA